MDRRVGPLKRAKLIRGSPRFSNSTAGTYVANSRKRSTTPRSESSAFDLTRVRAAFVPVGFGHVEVTGAAGGQRLAQTRLLQIQLLLLTDPGAVLASLRFPVPVHLHVVLAAGVPFHHHRAGDPPLPARCRGRGDPCKCPWRSRARWASPRRARQRRQTPRAAPQARLLLAPRQSRLPRSAGPRRARCFGPITA